MDQEVETSTGQAVTTLGRKAWTAYVGISLIGFFLLFGAAPVAWHSSAVMGVVVLVLSLGFIAYRVLSLQSYHLYCDEVGIWIYSGILPWSKGVRGVKWRDLDGASYFTSMWSWMFKSYSLQIGHRFTKSSEILLSHIAHGDKAVSMINEQHQVLVRANTLG
jgi:hypothetical protein